MTEYNEDPDTGIAEIVVDGKITKEDFEHVSERMKTFIANQGQIKFLEEISNFKGFDPSVVTQGIRFDIEHLKDISHCAVVTDMGWIGPFARAAGVFISCEIRVFGSGEKDQAQAWLREQ